MRHAMTASTKAVMAAFVFVLMALGGAGASGAGDCQTLRQQYSTCVAHGEATLLPKGDFSYIMGCHDQFPYRNACAPGQQATAASSIGNSARCNQDEARVNIDWVFVDVGATRTFQNAYGRGASALDAVLRAQGHNPGAQESIRNCAGWAAGYIASRHAAAIRGLDRVPQPPESCVAEGNGACPGCSVSCAPGYAARCQPGSPVSVPADSASPPSCWRPASCVCARR